jgi:cytochrome c-type biogenesis protein CcmH
MRFSSRSIWHCPIYTIGAILLLIALSHSVYAKVEVVEFKDPQKQALYQQLIKELRCLVCQNQNLADSNADLAIDLRRKTRELIEQGKNKKEVMDYMVTRYGEFVLYRPAFNLSNLFLWCAPLLLLLMAVWIAVRSRNRNKALPETYSEEDRRRVRQLLNSSTDDVERHK